MGKKIKSIPINSMADNFDAGVAIGRISVNDLRTVDEETLNSFDQAKQAHREDRHSFFLLENGTISIEIDFKTYKIDSSSVIYIHPNQVHRILSFENLMVSSWAISNENLNLDYLQLLESITPAKPLVLTEEMFSIVSEAVAFCTKISERTNDKLYYSLLKDSCNVLVALVVSCYLEQAKSIDKHSRFDSINKAFRELLENDYATAKRPAEYAQKLNISTSYLNECIKNTTGYSVSHHIQQRIILEAKRLLYYSDKSVKEIATDLGYDDYPYFSRLFTKVAGMTALTFRKKNLD